MATQTAAWSLSTGVEGLDEGGLEVFTRLRLKDHRTEFRAEAVSSDGRVRELHSPCRYRKTAGVTVTPIEDTESDRTADAQNTGAD